MDSSYETCRHVKTNGTLCQSPALANEQLCFFHHRDSQRRSRLNNALDHKRSTLARWGTPDGLCQSPAMAKPFDDHAAALLHALDLPLLEDAFAIQVAITNVMRALATQQIDHRSAGLLLYALQIASSNLKQIPLKSAQLTDAAQISEAAAIADIASELPPSEFDPRANISAVAASAEGHDDSVPHLPFAHASQAKRTGVGTPASPAALLDDLVALGIQLVREQGFHRGGRKQQLARAEMLFGKAASNGHVMRSLLERIEHARKKSPQAELHRSFDSAPPRSG